MGAYLKNKTVVLECPLCCAGNIVREAESCDCDLGQIGLGCTRNPKFLIPYNTEKGIVFECVCRNHIRHCGDIPFSGYIPETHRAIENAYENIHPVLYSVSKIWIIFIIVGAPIMMLYSLAGAELFFLKATRFSFFWLLFGLLWFTLSKTEYIKVQSDLNKILLKIWAIIFMIILISEITLHVG